MRSPCSAFNVSTSINEPSNSSPWSTTSSTLPRGHADRADQLTRAAESVVRNIAEGAGRWSQADSANRYKIARGEAMECAASLDVMKLRKIITDARYERGSQLLEAVVAMLTKMF